MSLRHDNLRIIILNWNLPDDTIECVESLLAAGVPAHCVMVVDNGSTDNSVETLSYRLPIEIVALPQNVGFAAGNNAGISRALADGVEWILLLNNDTIVDDDFFGRMRQATDSHPEYKLLAPMIVYYPPARRPHYDIIWSMGDRQLFGTLLTRGLHRNHPPPLRLPPLIDVDFLTGCCLLVHRTVFETIGLLNDDFFFYAEDADFCVRARQRGFRLASVTTTRIWHKVARSTDTVKPRRRYWRAYSQARFYRLHSRRLHRLLLLLYSLLRSLLLALGDLAGGRTAQAQATLNGWRQGWFAPPKRIEAAL